MANNKLQELTEQLYSEGLSKGRMEGEQILASAKEEAERIIADAREKAEKIIAGANADAAEISAKAVSDVKLASGQILSETKSRICSLIQAKSVTPAVKEALKDETLIKNIILSAAKGFSTENSCDISMVLPEGTQDGILDYVKGEVAGAIGREIEVGVSRKIQGGLTIGPRDGGYFISLSDETFDELIREYLRPSTRKILFGE